MAGVTVRYFGILRELAGRRVEKIKMEGDSNLTDLVKNLATRHGAKFEAFIYGPDGKLNKSLAFAVNGDSIQLSKLGRLKCKDVSEFVILPPIAGGS
ncbi:MAG: MoaD/ThiS family protein [Nitrososphaerales archaeon]